MLERQLKLVDMNEIRIPCPGIPDDKTTLVEVKMPGSDCICRYRIEPFLINDVHLDHINRTIRVEKLRSLIHNYDQHWELIQIFNTNENSEYVHILYREKNKKNINNK
jgi:hypothetical protein